MKIIYFSKTINHRSGGRFGKKTSPNRNRNFLEASGEKKYNYNLPDR
jgi:hypothetical protein